MIFYLFYTFLQAILLTAGVEHRLKNKVLRSAAANKPQNDQDRRNAGFYHKDKRKYDAVVNHKYSDKKRDLAESDSDDEGRGKAFGTNAQKNKSLDRNALLAGTKKKQKRKKNKL